MTRPRILVSGADGLIEAPGSDWAVLSLGCPGRVTKIEVDTAHFKGNFPESCMVEAVCVEAIKGGPT